MPIIDNSDSLKFCIGFADIGQPQGLSLRSAKIRKMAAQNQSVLCRSPSVSAYAEPAPFTQGSRNKILHCYKNCFQKLAMINLSCRRGSGASRSPHPTRCTAINHRRFRRWIISAPTAQLWAKRNNPSVLASPIQLPCRGAKIDSSTNNALLRTFRCNVKSVILRDRTA